jgi:hypothetical protein
VKRKRSGNAKGNVNLRQRRQNAKKSATHVDARGRREKRSASVTGRRSGKSGVGPESVNLRGIQNETPDAGPDLDLDHITGTETAIEAGDATAAKDDDASDLHERSVTKAKLRTSKSYSLRRIMRGSNKRHLQIFYVKVTRTVPSPLRWKLTKLWRHPLVERSPPPQYNPYVEILQRRRMQRKVRN